MGLTKDGKFLIVTDGTDWYKLSTEKEVDVTTKDKIIDEIADGMTVTEAAKHILVAQELGYMVEKIPPSKIAMLMGTEQVVRAFVSSCETVHRLGKVEVKTRRFLAEKHGRPSIVVSEQEFNKDVNGDNGDCVIEFPEPTTYREVRPDNKEIKAISEKYLFNQALGHAVNRLSEILVSGGMDEMKDARNRFVAALDEKLEELEVKSE